MTTPSGQLHRDEKTSAPLSWTPQKPIWVVSPDDSSAISRGGSWRTISNISERQIIDPDSCNGYTGFRIVRTYKPIEINKRPNK